MAIQDILKIRDVAKASASAGCKGILPDLPEICKIGGGRISENFNFEFKFKP
jgi:hypothetical protein